MIITNQRRMAAAILSQKEGRPVGLHRIWIDPDYLDEVISAVQKDDVRRLITDGIIKAGQSRELVGLGLERPHYRSRKEEERDTALGREARTPELQRKRDG